MSSAIVSASLSASASYAPASAVIASASASYAPASAVIASASASYAPASVSYAPATAFIAARPLLTQDIYPSAPAGSSPAFLGFPASGSLPGGVFHNVDIAVSAPVQVLATASASLAAASGSFANASSALVL